MAERAPGLSFGGSGRREILVNVEKPHIFLVDDFEDNREMYAYFLSDSGFRVSLASDGQEALDRAAELQPDLIIMDLSLPILDGWQATRRLKMDQKTRHIPIVILTAYELGSATPIGCDSLLIKPCLPDHMIAEVKRVLGRHGKPVVPTHSAPENPCP